MKYYKNIIRLIKISKYPLVRALLIKKLLIKKSYKYKYHKFYKNYLLNNKYLVYTTYNILI